MPLRSPRVPGAEGAPVAEVEGLEFMKLADSDGVSDAVAAVEGDVLEPLQRLQRPSVDLRSVLEAQPCRGRVSEESEVKEVNRKLSLLKGCQSCLSSISSVAPCRVAPAAFCLSTFL